MKADIANLAAAFALAAGMSLAGAVEPGAGARAEAVAIPPSCEFLNDKAQPVGPAEAGYPSNEEFRACLGDIVEPYAAMEREIQAARAERNREILTRIEKAKEELRAAEREALKLYEKNEITEEQYKAFLNEILMSALAIGLGTPESNPEPGGCMSPYHPFRQVASDFARNQSRIVDDNVLKILAGSLSECIGNFSSQIATNNSEPGEPGGYLSYHPDPEGLAARALRHAGIVQTVKNLAEARWCTYFTANPDSTDHPDHVRIHRDHYLGECRQKQEMQPR